MAWRWWWSVVGALVAEVGGIGRCVSVVCSDEADLYLGLSVFGVKNRIGYELAQFFLITIILYFYFNQFSFQCLEFRL